MLQAILEQRLGVVLQEVIRLHRHHAKAGALVEGKLVAEAAGAQLQALRPELPGLVDGVT